MIDARMSGCINHPGIEAVARCKQCGKPVCGACVITGPTGRFCGESCKEKHEKFVERAQEMQRSSRSTGGLVKLRRFLIKLVIFIVAIGALGFAAVYLDVPVAGKAALSIWQTITSYVPFLR